MLERGIRYRNGIMWPRRRGLSGMRSNVVAVTREGQDHLYHRRSLVRASERRQNSQKNLRANEADSAVSVAQVMVGARLSVSFLLSFQSI